MTRTRTFACVAGVLVALGGAAAAAEPTGELSLPDALALALLHHPGLAADSAEVRAREAEALQAGRRPNPELALELENFAGTGPLAGLDALETTLSLSQTVELGGKRAKRAEEARLDGDAAVWDREVRRIDVLAETAAAFVEVLAAQERVALADTLVGVADAILHSVSRRVSAGGVSPVEERRARVSLETSRVDRERAARALDVARARLSADWGGTAPVFERAVGSLELPADRAVPDLESLAARIEESAHVARWTTELDRRRASRDAARAAGTPDLAVGGGVRRFRELGATALVLGAGLELPLFDRKGDAADAAEYRIRRGEEERREAEARVRLALASAHAAVASSAAEAAALRDRVLPEAWAAFTESREAYARGRLRLSDVLDAERTAFELRGRYVDALAGYHVAATELERLLGTPLQEEGDRQP